MAFNPRSRTGHRLCKHLQCKEMFYDTTVQPAWAAQTDDEEHSEQTRYYWCLKSFREVSPDGQPCGAEECSPQRDCYEA